MRVKDVERMLNTSVNKTTSKTPYEALHGYFPRFRSGALSALSRTKNESVPPEEIQEEVRKTILQEQLEMKKRYDRKHFDGIRYDVGEVVVMLKQPVAGQPSKLQAKYREKPLQIMKVLPNDTYRIAELAASGREIFATTAHVSQLKSWRILRETDDDGGQSEDGDEDNQNVLPEHDDVLSTTQVPRPTRQKRAPIRYADYELVKP